MFPKTRVYNGIVTQTSEREQFTFIKAHLKPLGIHMRAVLLTFSKQPVPETQSAGWVGALEQWGRQGSTRCHPRDFPHQSVPATNTTNSKR